MKTLDDALRLRRRLLQALEMAELTDDPQQRAGWLTIAIVGAGPTGVEIAGQIRALVVRTLGTSFRRIDPEHVRVLLIDAGHEPLHQFGDRLSEIAARELGQLGVELRMGVKVSAVDAECARPRRSGRPRTDRGAHGDLGGGGPGVAAGAHAGRGVGRVVRPGRPDRGAPRLHAARITPRVFAIGDMVSLERLPGVAEVAMQQGLYAAKTIRRRVAGRHDMPPFKYRDLGQRGDRGAVPRGGQHARASLRRRCLAG